MEGKIITYSGAKLSLFISKPNQLIELKGDKKSIEYRRTPSDYRYTDQLIEADTDSFFYITTDGFLDQNGGHKGHSFGKAKFI